MPAGIARGISFCFDNAAEDPVTSHFADDGFADKIAGQLSRIDWQTGPCEPADIVHNLTPGMQLAALSFSVRPI
jgi:hypothetical protein